MSEGFDEWRQDGLSWDEAQNLWEHQGHPLLAGELASLLQRVDPSLRIVVEWYDGQRRVPMNPAEMGYFGGTGPRPDGVVISVLQDHG